MAVLKQETTTGT
jgi:hypothetical protein